MSTSGEWLKTCRRRVCPLAQETMMHARVHEPPSWAGRGCWHEKMNLHVIDGLTWITRIILSWHQKTCWNRRGISYSIVAFSGRGVWHRDRRICGHGLALVLLSSINDGEVEAVKTTYDDGVWYYGIPGLLGRWHRIRSR